MPSGADFGVTLAINAGIGILLTLLFVFFRSRTWARKFYSPKEYLPEELLAPQSRPKHLRPGVFGWIPQLLGADREEVIRTAGEDAWTFVRVCHLAIALFTFVTLWCGATCLVTNLLGGAVAPLIAEKANPTRSEYTYWVPPPPTTKEEEKKAAKQKTVKTPKFYVPDEELPKPPAGIEWKQYEADVPPLVPAEAVAYLRNGTANNVKSYTDEEIARFVLLRDEAATVTTVPLTDIDKATMANVKDRSPTLWVHAVAVWAVTAATLWLLRKFSREAVALRLRYLTTTPPGAETHSILVTDIPGIVSGTLSHKLDATVLRALPEGSRQGIKKALTGDRTIGDSSSPAVGSSAVSSRAASGEGGGGGNGNGSTTASTPKPLSSSSSPVAAADQALLDSSTTSQASCPFTSPQGLEIDPWGKAAAYLAGGEGDRTSQSLVEKEFDDLYPGQVAHVQSVYDTSAIDPLLKEYEKLKVVAQDNLDDYVAQARRAIAAAENAQKKKMGKSASAASSAAGTPMKGSSPARPSSPAPPPPLDADALTAALATVKRRTRTVRGALIGEWGRKTYSLGAKESTKIDAVRYCLDRMGFLEEKIKQEQEKAKGKAAPSAFVTFNSRRTQALATQALEHHDTTVWHVSGAPRPGGVIWPSLRFRAWERTVRFWGVWLAFVALMLLFLIPVAAIQKWVGAVGDAIPKSGPFKLVSGLVGGMLPPLVLVIFIALMPPILRLMGTIQGARSVSELDRGVITKFFIFQVATIFFGSFVAGSLFDTAALWAKDPAAGVRSLGLSAPTMSSFFLNYIAIKALFAPAFKNLRIVPFAIYAIRSSLSATERSKARLWSEQYQVYGVEVPQLTMVVLLGLVFCCINPLIPPACLLYFCVGLFFQKYRVMYVARPSYQTGGLMWTQIFDQVMTGVFLLQIIMFGFLSIKRSPAAAAVLVLIPLTILARAGVVSIFRTPLQAMSLRAAVDVDSVDKRKLAGGGGGGGGGAGGAAAAAAPSSSSSSSAPSLTASTVAKAANGGVAVDPSLAAEKLYVAPAMKFDGSDLAELKREAANVDDILAGKAPPPPLPDEDAIEAKRDAASEAEFQKQKTLRKQKTLERRASRRVSSAASSKNRRGDKGGSSAAPSASATPTAAVAAAAAAAAEAPAAARPVAAASTETEDVEAAGAAVTGVAAASSSLAATTTTSTAAAPAAPAAAPAAAPPRKN